AASGAASRRPRRACAGAGAGHARPTARPVRALPRQPRDRDRNPVRSRRPTPGRPPALRPPRTQSVHKALDRGNQASPRTDATAEDRAPLPTPRTKGEGSVNRLVQLAIVVVVAAAAAVSASAAGRTGASQLDGRWTGTLTQKQLIRAGASQVLAAKLHGSWTAQFRTGRFAFHDRDTGADSRGRFVGHGQKVRFVFASGFEIKKGQVAELTWNIYRDRLRFRAIPGRPSLLLDLFVWTRTS